MKLLVNTNRKHIDLEESLTTKLTLKKTQLRNNEYYDMQGVLDDLYSRSLKGEYFRNIYELIIDDDNIRLVLLEP